MPNTVTKEATVSRHAGKDLAEPFTYKFSFEQFGDDEKVPADALTEKEFRNAVNARNAAAASAKVRNAELESRGLIESPYQDEDKAIETLVRVYRAQLGLSVEDALAMAKKALGK